MTRRTVAATALGFDTAEMAHYLYQPSRFRIPVWAVDDLYLTVATPAEIARMDRDGTANRWAWEPHRDAYAQRLAGGMTPARTIWTARP